MVFKHGCYYNNSIIQEKQKTNAFYLIYTGFRRFPFVLSYWFISVWLNEVSHKTYITETHFMNISNQKHYRVVKSSWETGHYQDRREISIVNNLNIYWVQVQFFLGHIHKSLSTLTRSYLSEKTYLSLVNSGNCYNNAVIYADYT